MRRPEWLFTAVGVGHRARQPGPEDPGAESRWLKRVSWAFGAIGVAIFVIALLLVRSDLATLRSWVAVDAVVVEARIVASQGSSPASARRSNTYDTQVTFRYVVDGTTYENRTTHGVAYSNAGTLEERLATYAPGTGHVIHHRPGDPNVIRMDLGSALDVFFLSGMMTLMSFVFIGFGALTWIVFGRAHLVPGVPPRHHF